MTKKHCTQQRFGKKLTDGIYNQLIASISSSPGPTFPEAVPVSGGLLSHSTMTKETLRVKLYGDIALVTGRGQNTGTWQGQPLEADEWITDVYKKENASWLCVLTHLTPLKK